MELESIIARGGVDSMEQIESQSNPSLAPPPDGGLCAWSQVFAAHLINCLTWFEFPCFSISISFCKIPDDCHLTESRKRPLSRLMLIWKRGSGGANF